MSRRRTPEPATPAITRVEIALGAHQVVVEAAEALQPTIAAALQLFRDTAGDGLSTEPLGFTGPAVIGDPRPGQLLTAPEVPLPYHLIPQQETPDDRHT